LIQIQKDINTIKNTKQHCCITDFTVDNQTVASVYDEINSLPASSSLSSSSSSLPPSLSQLPSSSSSQQSSSQQSSSQQSSSQQSTSAAASQRSFNYQLTTSDSTPADKKKYISDMAFNLIISNFPAEILKTSTLTGKRGCAILNPEKIELIKYNTLMAVGGNDIDWSNSIENIQTKLRNYRKKCK